MKEAAGGIELSVVIAHHGVDQAIFACVRAHFAEMEPGDEMLVVVEANEEERAELAAEFEHAVVLAGAKGDLTPELWKTGIDRARGSVVRITIGCFLPGAGWRKALLAAHEVADVVGGPMEMARDLRWRDLAIFFQRYRAFRAPLPAKEVADVPADHSGYRASILEETRELWRTGFWERDVNAELTRRGRKLVLDPDFTASYVGGESARRFVTQRFRHAIEFGRKRLAGRGGAVRIGYVAAFLIPGAVFSLKIVRESLAVPKSALRLLAASGWLLLFVFTWALGEWVGAVLGPSE